MIFAFPYHDPSGTYNDIFIRNLPLLKATFNKIVISATPSTFEKNNKFVELLSSKNFTVYKNKVDSNIGDHFRNALKISLKKVKNGELIFYSFIDRVLYILESEYKSKFINDLKTANPKRFVIYERSEKAWNSHPKDYREMEQFINKLLLKLSGVDVEMNFCAISLNKMMVKGLLSESESSDWSITGEWILLALKQSLPLITKKVDWLSWEDPFWEKENGNLLKIKREKSSDETIKRIKTNLPFIELFIDNRFKEVFKT